MITSTLNFTRKNNNKIRAFASLTVQSPVNSKPQLLQSIKAAVTQWCDVTDKGNIIAGYTSNMPNVADIGSAFIENKELTEILKSHGIYPTDVSVNEQEPQNDPSAFDYDTCLYDPALSQVTCAECSQDLRERGSVTREYVNKDGGESEYCVGFYIKEGMHFHFEPSGDVSLAGGRYNLLDDSDKCTNCHHQL